VEGEEEAVAAEVEAVAAEVEAAGGWLVAAAVAAVAAAVAVVTAAAVAAAAVAGTKPKNQSASSPVFRMGEDVSFSFRHARAAWLGPAVFTAGTSPAARYETTPLTFEIPSPW